MMAQNALSWGNGRPPCPATVPVVHESTLHPADDIHQLIDLDKFIIFGMDTAQANLGKRPRRRIHGDATEVT
ncbi:MAG: hypothetical protein U1F59_12310 [Candidatus Competibacteraceae bacterium]|jgi:hypothetical protein